MSLASLYQAMTLPDVLEAVMLVCFGVAWPCATFRLLRTGRAQSNGLVFTVIILCGYVFGAASKELIAMRGAQLAPVFWLYALNAASVGLNLALQMYFAIRRRSRGHEERPLARFEQQDATGRRARDPMWPSFQRCDPDRRGDRSHRLLDVRRKAWTQRVSGSPSE